MAKKTVTVACPSCNHRHAQRAGHPTVYTCRACGALHGSCSLGESYEYVLPYWHHGESDEDDIRYFNLQCLGSKGTVRRHGFYNTRTSRIVQTS